MKITKRDDRGRPREIEYESEGELIIAEIMELLLDQGYSQGDAMILLRGSKVLEGLRSPTPVLDRLLTPELVDWLTE